MRELMRARGRYPSSTEVARLAGVSQSAVSRAFSKDGSVSAETRRKVQQAAETLGYRPSRIPRIMLTHRSHLVAVVVGGMYNPFYSAVLEHFTRELQATGHQVLLVHVESGESLDAVLPKVAGYRVDAVVSALAVLSPEAARECASRAMPIIAFNTPVVSDWISSVSCDNAGSAGQIARLFASRGARTFGFISGPPGIPASEQRLNGYREQLRALGFDSIRTAAGDFRYRGGYDAALALAASGKLPDALFCANDLMAIGALDAIRGKLGLRAPRDVMIAGFDGIPASSWAAYDLTTIVQDTLGMVTKSLSILTAITESAEPSGGVHSIVPGNLVERSTTRR